MCEIISVALDPIKLEIFWKPGMEHHTQICEAHGLNYDRVFKPDIHLGTKQIVFHDGAIAVRRTLPPELLSQLLLEGASRVELDIFYEWLPKHETAVRQWIEKTVPDHKKLIAFSEHSWNPKHYVRTLTDGRFVRAVNANEVIVDEDRELLREAWKRDFEKRELRSPVWQ